MTQRHTDTNGNGAGHRRLMQRPFVIPLATALAAMGAALTIGVSWGQVTDDIGDNTARIERVEQRVVAELKAINRKLDMLFSPRPRQ
jgi:hypothetical protein